MKKLNSLLLFLALMAAAPVFAQTEAPKQEGGLTWYTDIVKASELSKSTKRPLFAFFTGSDWCGWCKKLQATVFSKPDFIQWANKNVVLVELDFPRYKTLSPELTQQNNSLQQTFQVQGYPTVWLFYLNKNEKGEGYAIDALGSLGYPGGAEAGKEEQKFIKEANALFEKHKLK